MTDLEVAKWEEVKRSYRDRTTKAKAECCVDGEIGLYPRLNNNVLGQKIEWRLVCDHEWESEPVRFCPWCGAKLQEVEG